MAKGDGIESKGKTKGKQLGIDGSKIGQDGVMLSKGKANSIFRSNEKVWPQFSAC